MRRLALGLALLAASCTVRPPAPPVPPALYAFDLVACRNAPADGYCDGPAQAVFTLGTRVLVGDGDGYVYVADVPAGAVTLTIQAPGYVTKTLQVDPITLVATNDRGARNFFELASSFPDPPSRDQVLHVCMTFQGLTVETAQYGRLGWFDAALFSLQPTDRQIVYAAKRASHACSPTGDTHAIIQFDANDGSLYDEPNNPYQQMRGPAFEAHLPAFVAAVKETIANGFTPVVFLGGDGPNGYPIAMREFPIASDALAHADVGDLNRYVLWLPGWDSVFYGWDPPQKIVDFGALVRQTCPACYLGLEFNIGHIPLGEGGGDYLPGGRMQAFDVLFVEFSDALHDDSTWQILGRLLGPAYKRPADQPAGDDPTPPFYLRVPTPRGRVFVDCFEHAEYPWVRDRISAADVQAKRAYLYALGCSVVN